MKSLSVKQKVTFAGTNALARYTSSVGYADTFPSRGRLSQRGGIVPRGSLSKQVLPEHRNFLRCAQHLCCLSHPACPFSGGARGAEPH